jgi:hypothetical protein
VGVIFFSNLLVRFAALERVVTRSICEEKLPDLFGSREGGYVELRAQVRRHARMRSAIRPLPA